MWKLISFFLLLALGNYTKNYETIILIVNDCDKWRLVPAGNLVDQFSFYKIGNDGKHISLSHRWIESGSTLSTKILSISEMMSRDPIFTSDLNENDWYNLNKIPNRRIYIVRPDDYCSTNRFVYGFQFTLYEVMISLPIIE
jgi:hypothetical protein